MDAQREDINPIETMESDQLLSKMTLADRAHNTEEFVACRRELMYRLRCAEPLVNWYKPIRSVIHKLERE